MVIFGSGLISLSSGKFVFVSIITFSYQNFIVSRLFGIHSIKTVALRSAYFIFTMKLTACGPSRQYSIDSMCGFFASHSRYARCSPH